MVKYFSHIIIFILFSIGFLSAQQNSDLEKIRREIKLLESQLKQSESKLSNTVSTLTKYDRKISLLKKAISLMNKDIEKNRRELGELELSLEEKQQNIDTLVNLIEKQTFLLYLQGITNPDEDRTWWLNRDDSYRKKKYASFLLQYEKALADELAQNVRAAKQLKDKKNQLLTQLENARNLKAKEKRKIAGDYKTKQKLVKKIKNNQKLLVLSLKNKKESYKKLKNYFKELENKRLADKKNNLPVNQDWQKLSGAFYKLKGKLNWPVTGKIISTFGRHQDKKFKIVAVNNGIDIKAPKGTPVKNIHDGLVVKVTYMGGFGNMVIVDHNDGYYTVYSHLDNIRVTENSFAKSGDILGTVGDSGSMEGAKLHFEIYAKNKPSNPISWLKKR